MEVPHHAAGAYHKVRAHSKAGAGFRNQPARFRTSDSQDDSQHLATQAIADVSDSKVGIRPNGLLRPPCSLANLYHEVAFHEHSLCRLHSATMLTIMLLQHFVALQIMYDPVTGEQVPPHLAFLDTHQRHV